MSNMIVRPPQIYLDTLGNLATGWLVYIGRPNTDPRQSVNQITITDGVGGAAVSNPYTINGDGNPVNLNGQSIVPVVSQQQYSMTFTSQSGGILQQYPALIGDGLSGEAGTSGGIPDLTINNLAQAQAADLSAYNFVFIKAIASGWEGTASGSDLSCFYYRNGTTGAAGTGDADLFYDYNGNGWAVSKTHTEQAIIDNYQLVSKAELTGNNLVYTALRDSTFIVNCAVGGILSAPSSATVFAEISSEGGSLLNGTYSGHYADGGYYTLGAAKTRAGDIAETASTKLIEAAQTTTGADIGGSCVATFNVLAGTQITIALGATESGSIETSFITLQEIRN